MDKSISQLDTLKFDNRFVSQLRGDTETQNVRRKVRAAYSRVKPTPVADPTLVAYAREVGALIGIDEQADGFDEKELAEVFGGNRLLAGMDSFAMCYGGHQFSHWAGQLGDGRAINLGEVLNSKGEHWTLQLKGAGPTPYSRTADGLAVLRSSVREFLCSEAMFHLGVPTTRALSLVNTGEQVRRDMFYDGNAKLEPGAVVCRVAPSFVRFGNFELPSSRRDFALLRQLVDFTIRSDFPELIEAFGGSDSASVATGASDSLGEGKSDKESEDESDIQPEHGQELYAEWFTEVCRRTADMIVQWMRVGFVHGVMNTDNMSILGLTIDYGPYGWLEDFDPGWTPNTTDAQGRRYRFGHQPQIASWNLNKLANALVPLLGENPDDEWVASLQHGLTVYAERFNEGWNAMMAAKLGLEEYQPSDDGLFNELTDILQLAETDMTVFYRKLADVRIDMQSDLSSEEQWLPVLSEAYYVPDQLTDEVKNRVDCWLNQYLSRVALDDTSDDERRVRMNQVNPKYVLRNYLAQLAIDKAEEGDYSLVRELLEVLRHPYDEQPEHEEYAKKRPEWARHRAGCSMLSCSS